MVMRKCAFLFQLVAFGCEGYRALEGGRLGWLEVCEWLLRDAVLRRCFGKSVLVRRGVLDDVLGFVWLRLGDLGYGYVVRQCFVIVYARLVVEASGLRLDGSKGDTKKRVSVLGSLLETVYFSTHD
jgi:hypothetical protein